MLQLRCGLDDVEVFYLVQEEGHEEIADVVGPAEEQPIQILFFEDFMHQSSSQVYR